MTNILFQVEAAADEICAAADAQYLSDNDGEALAAAYEIARRLMAAAEAAYDYPEAL